MNMNLGIIYILFPCCSYTVYAFTQMMNTSTLNMRSFTIFLHFIYKKKKKNQNQNDFI